MKRIERIQKMEEKYDEVLKAVTDLDDALKHFQEIQKDVEELSSYYESNNWMNDFRADEEGKLPPDLKRGVLSEDGLYNLLSDYQRLKELLNW